MTKQLFKPGDVVGCIWAEGPHVLKSVGDGRDTYALCVLGYSVTADGKHCAQDAYPSVWHWETGKPPIVGERPKWKPEKPTWCWVRDESEDLGIQRLVIRYDAERAGYETVAPYGLSYWFWRYAEPCAPEDIPDWWPSSWR